MPPTCRRKAIGEFSKGETMSNEAEGLLRFMRTTRPREELRVALDVIRDFKACENRDEWAMPFHHWMRLEQLEDYLKLLVGDRPDEVSDQTALDYFGRLNR
jgi:hypothetical protein